MARIVRWFCGLVALTALCAGTAPVGCGRGSPTAADPRLAQCPVCGKKARDSFPVFAGPSMRDRFFVCSKECADKFTVDVRTYAAKARGEEPPKTKRR